jgi:hypothetical protein
MIALQTGARLEGRVVSSLTGQGVSGALLVVGRLGYRRFTRTDEGGKYRIRGLPEGEIDEVRVQAEGYGLMIINAVNITGDSTRLDLQLVPAIKLSGHVSDASGRPVPGAWVQIQPDQEAPELDLAENERSRTHLRHKLSVEGKTDSKGYFQIGDVNPASSIEITVRHPAYGLLRAGSFPAISGEQISGLRLSFPNSGGQ